LTLTRLDVDQNNIVVRFLTGSGLQFEFRDLSFTASYSRDPARPLAEVTGKKVHITIGVRLIQHEGHLGLELLPGDSGCQIQADRLRVDTNGLVGLALSAAQLKQQIKDWFISKLCPVIRKFGVPRVNTFLSGVAMETTLIKDENINLHYALSGDVTVTSNSLDVPFTGVILYDHTMKDPEIPALPTTGVVPVLTESDQMAYVGVSVDLFKTAGWALYNHGPFQLDSLEGPLLVKLTKEPDITLNVGGLSIKVEFTAQSLVQPPPPPLP
ncbi:uncharacterized protein LOC116685568, partial [Etheostoma spectabile]|uniref:uncharacterized protein LOC116685568 n=1 Tax=Etheostoma spectabile TaxID=54343 RepID=UPI0013AFC91E